MIDSHAHVATAQFDTDRAAVIERARAAGVSGWIEVGTDYEQSVQAIALAEREPTVWASVGVHPSDYPSLTPEMWPQLEALVANPKVVAIGEVGLDFYRGGTAHAQLPVLKQFIVLAQQQELPMIFHVRDGAEANAHDALIACLKELPDSERPLGVIHTFSGTAIQAQQYLDLGLYLSFSGVITFKNASVIADVAKSAPLDRILIETDCPFLAPMPHRGQRNEPAYISLVAAKLAELKGVSITDIATSTTTNAHTLFGLPTT